MTLSSLPAVVIHADWSMRPNRRWMTCAYRQPDGSYLALPPKQVPELHSFLPELQKQIGSESCALISLDFSIGLPCEYARLLGVKSFYNFLQNIDQSTWKDFFTPCAVPGQISLYRPFYPLRPGGAAQAHLLDALGLENMNQLRRVCERPTPIRRAASPIFWTMGAQQNGKATITGWRDLLIPALKDPHIHLKIWPFDGSLFTLFLPGQIIAAEAYPAEYAASLGIRFSALSPTQRTGKRNQLYRAANSQAILHMAESLQIHFDTGSQSVIQDGFGHHPTAEDAFDSTVGLLGLIAVLRGRLPSEVPIPDKIAAVEGWIVGQTV